MNVAAAEAPLPRGGELPQLPAAGGIQRVEVAVEALDVERATGQRRGGGDAAVGGEFPAQRTAMRIDGINVMVAAAEEHQSATYGWGGYDRPAGAKLPFHAVQHWHARVSVDATVARIGPESGLCGQAAAGDA